MTNKLTTLARTAALAMALAVPTAGFATSGFADDEYGTNRSPVILQSAQGFPLSLHQAQVTGLAEVREQVAAPVTEYKGFAASPAQMSVLALHTVLAQSIAAKSASHASEP
jgi:hypothetical protein